MVEDRECKICARLHENSCRPCGAGDAFLAASAPIAAVGGLMQQVGFVGNIAGALKVGIVGHRRSIDRSAIVKSILGLLK